MKPSSTRTFRNCVVLLTSVLLTAFIPAVSFAQPANDGCGAGTNLTSSTTCINIGGSLRNGANAATATGGINAFCGNAASPDVWYQFTAQSPYPVITLSGMGTNMDNAPRLQLFNTASCTVATLNANSLACVSGTNTATLVLDVATDVGGAGLTVGSTYKVRVFTNGNSAAAGTPATWNFNICVQDPIPPIPSNDECTGAIHLPVGGGCGGLNSSIASATLSAPATVCAGGAVTYDVWFKFTAVTPNPTISITGGANNFTNRRTQLFSGNCGSLTSIACGNPNITAAGLIPGDTYYVRVYSTSAGPSPSLNANFTICISTANLPPRFGNSYVNLTKKTTGGVVQTGDVLEIRMTINHTVGTLFRARYLDNIPTNTAMVTDSIRVITNEGLTFRRYTATPNVNDDAATYRPAPPVGDYNIRMNLGFAVAPGTPANNSETDITGATGQIANSDQPRGGGGVLFATAFRVTVTGTAGDTIRFGTGKFIYRTSAAGPDITINTTPFEILISNPMDLCSNSVGLSAAEEFGGTFGTGTSPNRITDLSYPIPGYTFVNSSPTQGVGDGQYAIVKNMSPRYSTTPNANKQPSCGTPPPNLNCNNRMHNGFWDIAGDHTGTNDAVGNAPPDVADNAGYMLMVNADYVASEVYRQSLTGLCPNTFYEFSAWMKNICTPCGIDATGTSTYRPGVYPNLTFILDGVDRYSTGEIDTLGWIKKGFVFITGPTQTSVTFAIRNNSQGGGGNDWVIDDISVATCMPEMAYSPSANPNVCRLNAVTIYDTVRSFFNNYVYYKWQRSEDGGATYTDITLPLGPATPVFNSTTNSWEYLTHYSIPPWWADVSNNGDLYRVVAATTVANLSSTNCVATSGIPFLTLNVLNCGTPLKTDLLSFNAKLVGDMANLTWTTSKEDEPVKYQVERSADGTNFTAAGVVNGYNNNDAENRYTFIDPVPVTGKVYYRVAIVNNGVSQKYSRIIPLSKQGSNQFAIGTVVNPFSQVLSFDIISPADMKVDVELLDMFGKLVKSKSYVIRTGVNVLNLNDTGSLPAGTYVFRVKGNDQILTRKVVKNNRF